MKPHRMRITHNIVTAYGLIDKMDVLVSVDMGERDAGKGC